MLPHPPERFRLYIDETGIQSLKSAEGDPFLCLFGVIMRRRQHDGLLTDRLFSLKRDLFGHSEEAPVILHRREIVRGEPPFDLLRRSPSIASEFTSRWQALVRETPFICMAATIDKKAHLEKYKVWQFDPYHYCLECLLERYVKWMNRHGLYGDVVIESRGRKPDKRLKQTYERFYRLGNSAISRTIVQARLTTNQLKFASKSDDVAALQLADSLAHPTLAYMKAKALGQPNPETFGQTLVDTLIAHKYARNPTTGEITGWGLKTLP